MIFFYGIRSFKLKSISYPQFKCSHCGNTGTQVVTVYQRYFHLFWIPCFPIGKIFYSTCSHCQKTVRLSGLPQVSQTTPTSPAEKIHVGTPWYSFIGLMIIALLLIIGAAYEITRINVRSNHLSQYFNTPKVNDIYVMKEPDQQGYYSLLQISSIQGDKITFSAGRYIYDDIESAEDDSDARTAGYFGGDTISYTKGELTSIYQKKELGDIIRP